VAVDAAIAQLMKRPDKSTRYPYRCNRSRAGTKTDELLNAVGIPIVDVVVIAVVLSTHHQQTPRMLAKFTGHKALH
jgi:hypothetical protein